MHFAEVEIHGSLMQRWQPAGTRIGNGRAVLGEHVVVAGDVIRQIDQAEAEGVRSLLIVMEGEGGDHAAALVVYRRLRAFSERGGHTIAFIRGRCASTLPVVAQAADRVLVAPEGRIVLHAAHAPAGRERDAEEANRVQVALLAARTPVPREKLESWTSEVDAVVDVHAAGSVRLGLADAEATLEAARSIAEAVGLDPHALDAPRYVTARSRYLAKENRHVADDYPAAAPGVAGHQTQSSDGATSQWPTYNPELRLRETAASNWTPATGASTGTYYAVAWNGSVFCAVGSNACATSPDGLAWTTRTIPAGIYQGVAWNGSVFCAVGDVAATSPDGITWTARTIPGSGYDAVAWNGSVFCAVGIGGGGVCATSPDGITWTSRTIPTGDYRGIAWNGSVFCAVGQFDAVATSPDGVTWTARTASGSFQAVAWNGVMFTAVGTSACMSSADGITWVSGTIQSGSYMAIAAFAGVWVAVGVYGLRATSLDGLTWTDRSDVAGGTMHGVASNGRRFGAIGVGVAIYSLEA